MRKCAIPLGLGAILLRFGAIITDFGANSRMPFSRKRKKCNYFVFGAINPDFGAITPIFSVQII